MTTKLYVGNIAYSISGTELAALFAEVGTVTAVRLVSNHITGKSRGFGFIEMANPHQAQEIITQFNGYTLLGRKLLVHLAHDDKELSQRIRQAKQSRQQGNLLYTNPIEETNQNFYSQVIKDKPVQI